jgi:hypothetical protein
MDSEQIQTSSNKLFKNAEVEKSIKILDAIEKCSCDHCLNLLKNGLRDQQSPEPTEDTTKPVTKRFGYV